MAQNSFILLQIPSEKPDGINQIYVVASNDIPTLRQVLEYGAKEVGRVQTSLSREHFVAGMNAQNSAINAKYAVALTNIKESLKKAGML